jgi:hypothetical protein
MEKKGGCMRLSKAAQEELEHMRRQVRDNPYDEAEPTARFDRLPQDEKDYINDEYDRIGGK